MKLPVCEVCGKPATNAIRNVFVNDNWDTGVREMSPDGDPHLFCDKHKRESTFTDITESPLTHFYRKLQENEE